MSTIRNVVLAETAGSAAQNPSKPCPPDQPNCEKTKLLSVEKIGLKNATSIAPNFAMNGSTKCWIA